MRPERLYLQDILDACDAIERFLRRTKEIAATQDELSRAPSCKSSSSLAKPLRAYPQALPNNIQRSNGRTLSLSVTSPSMNTLP